MTLASPIPKNLRAQIVETIEVLPEEDLVFVYDMLLEAEKQRLWREIQVDAEAEQKAGKWERLPEIIREVRARRQLVSA